ncbi:glutaminase A [Aquipuribacter sp. SD81]|uniref:glutaminase A n=1 Tax=Aquipuribacter sp. SD81 TaxID=3127703 RepID=UPI003015894E
MAVDEQPLHPITRRLQEVHDELLDDSGGEIRSSIPALQEADPEQLAVALCTADGHLHGAGDVEARFTIQSIVKPFVYALALADSGHDAVLEAVGVEPTGEAFNALVLEEVTGRPPNPMVNAGAILTGCLVAGDDAEARRARIRDGVSAFAGRRLDDDERVSESEKGAGERNRALAWLMKAEGSLPYDVEEALDVYVFACSLLVDVRDLAVMGATLAAGGLNPLTGEQVVPATVDRTVLSVMATCGMYDGAGRWFTEVGLPAKSGVAGGIVAVQPGQLGIGAFSPRLDEHGNSVRAARACRLLSDRLGMHELRPAGKGLPVVAGHERHEGGRLHVLRLQGPLTLRNADEACSALLAARTQLLADGGGWLVVDLTGVGWLHEPAVDLLEETVRTVEDAGIRVRLVDRDRGNSPDWEGSTPNSTEDSLEAAVGACEEEMART